MSNKLSVVKVQRNLGGDDPRLLVYAEGRKMLQLMAPTDAINTAMGNDPKAYFLATWEGRERGWQLGTRLWDQHW